MAVTNEQPRRAGPLGGEAWAPSADVTGRLVAYACTIVGPSEAEDVAQETLIRVGRARSPLRDHDRADAWLFRICRHVAIDLLRSRRVRASVWASLPEGHQELLVTRPPAEMKPSPQALDWSRLSAHQRLLLCLHAVRGRSQAQLSASTGLSPPALRVRLFRARRALAGAVVKASRPVGR